MKMSGNTLRLTETALMIALATVLNQFAVIQFPFGGSVTLFSQVPIIILSYRYGIKWGLFSGFVMSILQMLFGLNNFSYVNGIAAYTILVLADYLFPYTLLGLGGIFKGLFSRCTTSLALGAILVSVIRFICHFISGVTIWASWTDNNSIGGIIKYSIVYNGSYMLPELIITVIGVMVIGRFINLNKEKLT